MGVVTKLALPIQGECSYTPSSICVASADDALLSACKVKVVMAIVLVRVTL